MIARNTDFLGRVRKEFVDSLFENCTYVEPQSAAGTFQFMDTAQFLATDFRQEWLVDNLMVANQPMVIGGPKKALKTSILIDLAASLASGRPFLGRFRVCTPRSVGVFSGESGGATLKATFQNVCHTKEIDRPDRLPIQWSLRVPNLSDPAELATVSRWIEGERLEVIVIDPLYLALLRGNPNAQASNLYDIGPLLGDVTQACLEAGATPIVLHHFRKTQFGQGRSTDFEPPELDDLAFAGIGEFARQWLLIKRRKRYDPATGTHELCMAVGGSAGHSSTWGLDIDEGRLQTDFRGRRWSVTVRTQLEQIECDQRMAQATAQEKEGRKDAEGRESLLRALREMPEGLTANQLSQHAGMRASRMLRLISALVEQREVVPCVVKYQAGPGTRAGRGYRLNHPENMEDSVENTADPSGDIDARDQTGRSPDRREANDADERLSQRLSE